MENQIINTLQDADDAIHQLEAQFERDKEFIRQNNRNELEQFEEVLEQTLNDWRSQLNQRNNAIIDEANAMLKQQVDKFRDEIFEHYATRKDELVNEGVREVLATYGNFRND